MIRFTIPYPATKDGMARWSKRYSLNAYWAGKHYQARRRDAEEIHALTLLCMKQAGIRKQLLDCPVEIWFHWNDGLDADNHAAIGKMAVDAMKGYLLRNDSRKWFKGVHHVFWEGKEILVEVKEYEKS